MTQAITKKQKEQPHPLMTVKRRLEVWGKMRGTWKNRQQEPIKELKQMRKGWERKFPNLS